MALVPGRITDERLLEYVGQAGGAAYSYHEVGATQSSFPPEYHHDRYSRVVGSSVDDFDRACEALRHWHMQRGAGARVIPADSVVATGQTIVVAVALPLLTLVAPCRVVYVVEEPDRFGYAYGTLEGHPEQGEESFFVHRRGDGVELCIEAFSRPRHPLARLGAPVGRYLQKEVTQRYLASVRRYVDGASG